MKVYHYTDQESFELINKMKKMLPSTQNTTRDAYGGDGWYFTDLTPDNPEHLVAYTCWSREDMTAIKQAKCFFVFEIDPVLLKNPHGRKNVFLLERSCISDGLLNIDLTYSNAGKIVIKCIGDSCGCRM